MSEIMRISVVRNRPVKIKRAKNEIWWIKIRLDWMKLKKILIDENEISLE